MLKLQVSKVCLSHDFSELRLRDVVFTRGGHLSIGSGYMCCSCVGGASRTRTRPPTPAAAVQPIPRVRYAGIGGETPAA